MKLEIACFNAKSALVAAAAGADRIEFCAAMELGGITPNLEGFVALRKKIATPINVMIRPRGGSFVHTKEELQKMEQSLIAFKEAGADGFVFGILEEDNKVAIESCQKLLQLADGLPCTFHRAFDRAENREESISQLITLGFQTVLTSGGNSSALGGIGNLSVLHQNYGDEITIMAGGGVRADNVAEICTKVQADWVHSSAVLSGDCADVEEIKKMKSYLTSS